MEVLHATIDLPSAAAAAPAVLFWAEKPEVAEGRAFRGSPGAAVRKARPHPFAAPAPRLTALLTDLGDRTGAAPLGNIEPLRVAFPLPSTARRPFGSWEMDGGGPAAAAAGLAPWAVPALRADLAAAVPLLARVPVGASSGERHWRSPDLQFLAHASRYALGLLGRRRIVPAVAGSGPRGGRPMARWRAAMAGDDDLARFDRLRAAMPASARAAIGDAPPEEVLRGFLDGAVDALARSWLAQAPPPVRTRGLPEDRWASALSAADPRIHVPPALARELERGLDAWSKELTGRTDGAIYRTCFRLDPPRVAGPREVVPLFDVPEGDWRVRFFLQARDDPSLLVPARTVFAAGEGPVRRRGRVFEGPQDRLLADLARAGRLFPPLARALEAPRPEACRVSLEEAHAFLREAAPLLSECGFGVLVPPWWGGRRPALTAEVEVLPKDDDRRRFGLDALVDFNWRVAVGDQPISEEDLLRLAELKVPLVRLLGQWVELRPREVAAALEALKRGPRQTLTLAEAMQAAADGEALGLPVTAFRARGWVKDLMEDLAGAGRLDALEAVEGLEATLRPYQARGVAWLAFLRRYGLGACLADDMGLGKTLQALALRLHLVGRGEARGPWLLVAPTSVLVNWRREAERFAPTLRVAVHHGQGRAKEGGALAASAAGADLLVTSYALLWRDAKELSKVKWDAVVLDEAQNIKNPLTKAAEAARGLSARHRVALTGTPVENRLAELWSIFEFLNPGYLGGLSRFRDRYAAPIEQRGDEEASRALRQLVRPFILRRVKTDKSVIADLPDKVEQKVYCTLTREQATLYQAVVEDLLDRADESEGIDRRAVVLSGLTKLKQVLDHPALLLKDRSVLDGRSGKLTRLLEMLDEAVAEGDRALVFTQYAEMGRMLRRAIEERIGPGIPFLHGGLSPRERDQMVQTFQAEGGPPAFVLSLKAGGFGLNLTAANRVFHYDRWWNPAVEDQATDRAFRIGQKRNVLVHKFVVAGTLEERIDEMLESKKGLAGRVIADGERFLTELDTRQLRELLTLRADAVEVPEREDVREAARLRVAARGVA